MIHPPLHRHMQNSPFFSNLHRTQSPPVVEGIWESRRWRKAATKSTSKSLKSRENYASQLHLSPSTYLTIKDSMEASWSVEFSYKAGKPLFKDSSPHQQSCQKRTRFDILTSLNAHNAMNFMLFYSFFPKFFWIYFWHYICYFCTCNFWLVSYTCNYWVLNSWPDLLSHSYRGSAI